MSIHDDPSKILLLNIGNSTTQVVVSDYCSLGQVHCFPTPELIDYHSPLPAIFETNLDIPWIIASVVPQAADRVRRLKREDTLTFIHAEMVKDIDFSAVDSSTLGADRIANAAAAVASDMLPVCIIDFGTCITLELVDAEKRFRGGGILPGRRMMRTALAEQTAQLPEIDLPTTLSETPGRNTPDAINFGVDDGLIGAIERLKKLAVQQIPQSEKCACLATGGDQNFFVRHIENLVSAPSDFTLAGLLHIARSLREK